MDVEEIGGVGEETEFVCGERHSFVEVVLIEVQSGELARAELHGVGIVIELVAVVVVHQARVERTGRGGSHGVVLQPQLMTQFVNHAPPVVAHPGPVGAAGLTAAPGAAANEDAVALAHPLPWHAPSINVRVRDDVGLQGQVVRISGRQGIAPLNDDVDARGAIRVGIGHAAKKSDDLVQVLLHVGSFHIGADDGNEDEVSLVRLDS